MVDNNAHVTNVQVSIRKGNDVVVAEWDSTSRQWSIDGMVYPRHMKLLWQISAAVKEADD